MALPNNNNLVTFIEGHLPNFVRHLHIKNTPLWCQQCVQQVANQFCHLGHLSNSQCHIITSSDIPP